MRNARQWLDVLLECGVRPEVAVRWSDVFAMEIRPATFSAGEAEVDDFLGQILHESNLLSKLEESLYYRTAERIRLVWPSRFPTVASAQPFARNPQALANRVYGGRLGNTETGDGWRYRGSGLIQCTGRDNFRAVGRAIGIDLVANPDLLRTDPHVALRASIAWWEGNVPDSVMGDVKRVTRRVNGGEIGLAHRAELTDKARDALA